MTTIDRILYAICIISAVVLAALILAAIWGEIDNPIMWKGMGTVTIIMLVSGFILAVNAHVQKMRSEKTKDEGK